MKTVRFAPLAPLAAALALAACSGDPAPKAPLNEGAAAIGNESENVAEAAPPPVADRPPISDEQRATELVEDPTEALTGEGADPTPQVLDDAAASGMTSRLPADGDVQPVEGAAKEK